MNVDELYQFVKFYINKEKGDHFTPDSFNLVVPRALDDFFTLEYGLPEKYLPGMPIPAIAYANTQNILDDLSILIEKLEIYLDADAKLKYPADYVHVSSVSSLYRLNGRPSEYVPVEIIDDDKQAKRESHPYKKPSAKYPICVFYSKEIEFKPKARLANTPVRFNYLRFPKKPFRAYTIVNDNDVYDAGNSTQIELPPMTHNKIARILLSYAGVHLRDDMVTGYAQAIKNNGI